MGETVDISRDTICLRTSCAPTSALLQQNTKFSFFHFFRTASQILQRHASHSRNRSHLSISPDRRDSFFQNIPIRIGYQYQSILQFHKIALVQLLLMHHQLFPAQCSQFIQAGHACDLHKIFPDPLFFFQGRCVQYPLIAAYPALKDRLCDHPLGQRAGNKHLCAHTPGGLPEHRDVLGISSECCDILIYPGKRSDLVQYSVISRHAFFIFLIQPWMGEKSKDSDPVIDRHQDDILRAEGFPVEFLLTAISSRETASVNIERHRQSTSFLCAVRHPEIQIQAVFTHRRNIFFLRIKLFIIAGSPRCFRIGHSLRTHIAESVCRILSVPWFNRFRFSPSHLPDRCLGIGNPPEDRIAILSDSPDFSSLRLYDPVHRNSPPRVFHIRFYKTDIDSIL